MASGLLVMDDTTTGLTGGPGDVHTSSDRASAPPKTKLRTPTSEKNQTSRNKVRQVKKFKKPDLLIKIPQEKIEEEKMKQPSLNKFMEILKKKLSEKENEAVADENLSDWDKDLENDSREATVR